jgi:hypothetical protein
VTEDSHQLQQVDSEMGKVLENHEADGNNTAVQLHHHHSHHKNRTKQVAQLDDTNTKLSHYIRTETAADIVDDKKKKRRKQRSEADCDGEVVNAAVEISKYATTEPRDLDEMDERQQTGECGLVKRKKTKKSKTNSDTVDCYPNDISSPPSAEVISAVHSITKPKRQKHSAVDKEHVPCNSVYADCEFVDEATRKNSTKVKKADVDVCGGPNSNSQDVNRLLKQKRKHKHKQKQHEMLPDKHDACTAAMNFKSVDGECVACPLSAVKEPEIHESKKKRKTKQHEESSSTVTDQLVPMLGIPLSTCDQQAEAKQSSSLGQWKDVTFDAQERQQKFLRLLGGMKKPTDGHQLKPSPFCRHSHPEKLATVSSVPSSLAMSAAQQSHLDKTLEEQFEKAREFAFKKQKGIGLGFEQLPGAGKALYIDPNAIRSKHFDE